MAKLKYPPIQPDWITKTLAGFFLGYGLALGLVGVFAWVGPGGIEAPNKVQFNMWVTPMLWLIVFSLVYLCRSGKQAWLILGLGNVLVFGVLAIVKLGMQ